MQSKFVVCLVLIYNLTFAQSIGDFMSIAPVTTRQDTLILPATHQFQYLIKTGDTLGDGRKLGKTLDFTGYVPILGSKKGFLSISSEIEQAEATILTIEKNEQSNNWEIVSSGKIDFYSPAVKEAIATTTNFCSGTVTSWGTVVVGEERDFAGDKNKDGYDDIGWLIELDPKTWQIATKNKQGQVQKLWAMGRVQHENVCINKDKKTCYYGADSRNWGYVYKFIAKKEGDLSDGSLYVLKMDSNLVTAKHGTWVKVPNTTQEDRNNTNKLAEKLGATHFKGVEDVEIGPDGKIYFTAKYAGRVYRFKDLGKEITESEVYVDDKEYPVKTKDGVKMIDFHSGDTGADNLAFDGDGNLWVMNDGGNDGIWVIRPNHSATNPQVELFAETPAGCEPTGITFSPDYKNLFISLQHPSPKNAIGQKDKNGKQVIFNTSHTIVISRR